MAFKVHMKSFKFIIVLSALIVVQEVAGSSPVSHPKKSIRPVWAVFGNYLKIHTNPQPLRSCQLNFPPQMSTNKFK